MALATANPFGFSFSRRMAVSTRSLASWPRMKSRKRTLRRRDSMLAMCCDLVVMYCEVVLHGGYRDEAVHRTHHSDRPGGRRGAGGRRPEAGTHRRASHHRQAPCSENGGLGYLWASNFRHGTVVRIDPATNRVTARVKVGPRPCGVAVGADALWVDGYGTDNGERVDPQM